LHIPLPTLLARPCFTPIWSVFHRKIVVLSFPRWFLQPISDPDWHKREANYNKERRLQHLLKCKTELVTVADIRLPAKHPRQFEYRLAADPNRQHDAPAHHRRTYPDAAIAGFQ